MSEVTHGVITGGALLILAGVLTLRIAAWLSSREPMAERMVRWLHERARRAHAAAVAADKALLHYRLTYDQREPEIEYPHARPFLREGRP